MRHALAPAMAALLLAGCGSHAAQEPAGPIDSVQLNAIASSGPTVAETLAKGNDAIPAAPAPTAFDYTGQWAPRAALCRTAAWRFAARRVTPGEGSCAVLTREARTDSEVKLTLSCVTGAVRSTERWALVRREDGSMIVARTAGNGIPQSTTLRRCD